MTPAPARYLKLPLGFDAARLQAELDALLAPQWVEHFNTRDYEGRWRCLALRARDGRPGHIGAQSGVGFLDTPALAQCLARLYVELEQSRLNNRLAENQPDSDRL